VGVDAFSGEYLVAIEDLKETSHAPHLFVNVFLQVLVAYDSRRHFFFYSVLGLWVCVECETETSCSIFIFSLLTNYTVS